MLQTMEQALEVLAQKDPAAAAAAGRYLEAIEETRFPSTSQAW